MTNKGDMEKVLVSLKGYLQSIELYQSGEKTKIDSDNLEKLEQDMESEAATKPKTNESEYKSDSFEKFVESIEKIEFTEGVVPYTAFSKLIYTEAQDKRELLDMLEDTMASDWNNYRYGNVEVSNETTRKFLKIKEHIGLSVFQRNHISDRLSEQLEDTQNKLKETDERFAELSKSLDIVDQKAHEKADKLVVQFITILGIFAAIMMSAIGSFQGFTSIFSNAENIPIGKTLIISAIGASGVSVILFTLLHSISKLTSFTLSNCDCKDKKRGALNSIREAVRTQLFGGSTEIKCTCSLFNKYPTIFIVNYLFYYIAYTGFIFMYFNFSGYFGQNHLKLIMAVILLYFLATAILIIFHRYLFDKASNDKSVHKFITDMKKTPGYFKDAFKS